MPDTFRKTYKQLTKEEESIISHIKGSADVLEETLQMAITNKGTSREMSLALTSKREVALAKTKLEESVMWAIKGLTK